MTGTDWLAATGLLLVIEGILPFAAPAVWRDGFRRMLEFSDGQLRFIGAASMLGGVFLLLMLN
ncbi:MAG: uncharacterized protein QG662_413 [Pseudomonadota bacterium]|nr:uncharacterized protein [Pseudomonadota bacterium]